MSKVRVYELAKENNITSKELMAQLKDLGIEIKTHMSVLEGENLDIVRELLKKEKVDDLKHNDDKIENTINNENRTEVKKTENKKNSVSEDSVITVEKKSSNVLDNEITVSKKKRKKNKNKSEQRAGNNKNTSENKGESLSNKAIEIPSKILVKDFADAISVSTNQLITKLIHLGVMANVNQEIDFDTAEILAAEFNKEVVIKEDITSSEEIFDIDYEDNERDLKKRPPVVTVMGHVDHGKTSLLDSIRNTHVTRGEAGGITQHIGAYTVRINNNKITFLDTPGHEAFTSMRSRGAQITDIAILVVAADDGVMPQTIEAINHAKAAEVPIIVAVNKMDKPDANVDRIKQELADNGLMPDDWGGDAIIVPVSARTGDGIEELLEMILMVTEMEELKANPNRRAVGTIIEAQLDKGRGPTATVLVQKGTLNSGDMVVTGISSGRVRAMFDDKGKKIKKAGPSIPVLILGLSDVPEAGELIYAVEDEKTARGYADKAKTQLREDMLKPSGNISLDELFGKISDGSIKDLNIIVKTDVKGTIDAVKKSLEKLSNEEVKVKTIHGGVGGITESDVMLATASNAIIIGFNVRPTQSTMDMAAHEGVDLRTYRVIYEAIEDVQSAIQGMLAPKFVEEVIGRAEVRATFKVPHQGTVAGVYVTNGKITRNASVRLVRDNLVIYEGKIGSLRRFKDDTKELASGYEGGLGIENYNDLREKDIIEAFVMKEVKPK